MFCPQDFTVWMMSASVFCLSSVSSQWKPFMNLVHLQFRSSVISLANTVPWWLSGASVAQTNRAQGEKCLGEEGTYKFTLPSKSHCTGFVKRLLWQSLGGETTWFQLFPAYSCLSFWSMKRQVWCLNYGATMYFYAVNRMPRVCGIPQSHRHSQHTHFQNFSKWREKKKCIQTNTELLLRYHVLLWDTSCKMKVCIQNSVMFRLHGKHYPHPLSAVLPLSVFFLFLCNIRTNPTWGVVLYVTEVWWQPQILD